MTDAPSAWSDVGNRFAALGHALKAHFDDARSAGDDPTPPAADPATGAPPSAGAAGGVVRPPGTGSDPGGGTAPSDPAAGAQDALGGSAAPDGEEDDAVRAALRRLADAIDGVVTAVGATVTDPTVKREAREVGGALSEALSRSFAAVGDDLRKAFSKARGGRGDADDSATDGTTTTEYGYPTTTDSPTEPPPTPPAT